MKLQRYIPIALIFLFVSSANTANADTSIISGDCSPVLNENTAQKVEITVICTPNADAGTIAHLRKIIEDQQRQIEDKQEEMENYLALRRQAKTNVTAWQRFIESEPKFKAASDFFEGAKTAIVNGEFQQAEKMFEERGMVFNSPGNFFDEPSDEFADQTIESFSNRCHSIDSLDC